MFPEEQSTDIQGLADMKCHVCGGLGHMARKCATPNPKGGKGGIPGGKGFKGGPKGGPKGLGKGKNNGLHCYTCGKMGHLPDRCWKAYPEERKRYKGYKGKVSK